VATVRRRRSNPLALAVLATLLDKQRHPYDIAATLRARQTENSVRLNYGSLYSTVDALARDGMIEAVETVTEGQRPPRTIYRITPAGVAEFREWLSRLLDTPVKEYPQFQSGLAFLLGLPPEEALQRLRGRVAALEERLATMDAQLEAAIGEEFGVPRVVLLETEYEQALCQAELAWVRRLLAEIDSGTLDGLAWWHTLHSSGEEVPPVD
jgi:DNA-binding PadR family transcriptional regulator